MITVYACVCFEIDPHEADWLKENLAGLAADFAQDSIAWAIAETEFIPPATTTRGVTR